MTSKITTKLSHQDQRFNGFGGGGVVCVPEGVCGGFDGLVIGTRFNLGLER
ncbi:MAG TPA: hypothetical protein VKV73_06225 [Chloroflexota bacterium]|nr:hypothetical protein [Chloroflexota bacterium]